MNKVESKTEQIRSILASRSATLFVADCLCFSVTVIVAVICAMTVRYYTIGVPRPPIPSDASRILIVFGVAFTILIFRSSTLGHYTQYRPFWLELKEVLKTVALIAAFDAFLLFAIGVHFSRLWFGFFLILLCLFIPYGRERTKLWMIKYEYWYQPTLIIGTGSNAKKTANALKSDPSLGHKVIGFVNLTQTDNDLLQSYELPVYDDLTQAYQFAEYKPSLVFAFDSMQDMEAQRSLINNTIAENLQITIVPPDMNLPLYGATVVGIFRHDTALLKLQNRLVDPTAQLTKRCTDIFLGVVLLTLFLPIFIILAIFIRRDGGPTFFNHTRMGENGKHFKCHKFRTMKVESDFMLKDYLDKHPEAKSSWLQKQKLINDPRVTRIGRYLRCTSVDELPQLVNVIKGEMSLVGPRPIVDEEIVKYGSSISYYKLMKPGMTGLWQVCGRTDTTYTERVQLDVWYCRNWTLWNDVVILLKTCKTLMNRHGAY